MTDEHKKFEAWFEDQIWGNEDFKTCLLEAWQARAVLASQQKPVAGLDEVAEKVWRERAWLERPELVQFRDAVRAIVAELKVPEQIGYIGKHVADALKSGRACTMAMTVHKALEDDFAVFVAPVITEPAVPTGWKLVPIEPTEEMVKAGTPHTEGDYSLPYSLYKAMLAAAPETPHE